MKGAVLYGIKDLRVEDVPEPQLEPDEVAIRPVYTGICGSEVHFYVRGFDPGIPNAPQLLGHEYAGIVTAVGDQVTLCYPGDRVTSVPWAQCGQCGYCRRGLVNHCPHKRRITGAFAESLVVAQSAVYHVPPNVPLRRATLAEPMSCAVWALDQAALRTGETVVIIGAGPIGLLLLMLAQWSGAAQTIVAEYSPVRRALAAELGATQVVDPREVNLTALVQDVTDGLGADVAFEVVGHPSALRSALDCVRHAATVVVVGVTDSRLTLNLAPWDIYHRELTIRGSYTRRHTYDRAMQWLHKPIFDRLISHEMPMREIVAGFELAASAQCAKVVILPNGPGQE